MARADALPLVLPVLGGGDLPRGTQVLLRVSSVDDITLDVSGQFIALRENQATLDSADDDEQDDDATNAGPLTIAVDLNETETSSAEGSGSP